MTLAEILKLLSMYFSLGFLFGSAWLLIGVASRGRVAVEDRVTIPKLLRWVGLPIVAWPLTLGAAIWVALTAEEDIGDE